ncbi:MAG: response regulator [Aquabacterium sp.]
MGQARVLITDDDETTLEMLDAALQDRYRITTARSGLEALHLAREHDFDMVLLDVDMPEMDGYATCTALKTNQRTADVPVLFLSARVNIDERLQGYRVGGTDYLTKPFDVVELTAKIELAVGQGERNRRLNSQIEEVKHTAQATADKYDEVGVVLAFQRELGQCRAYVDIAVAFFGALERMGFEGCLRLTGRQGVMSRSGQGECSALGHSLLDHLEAIKGAQIQAVGDNTSFHYGNVLILVRNLPLHAKDSQCGQDELDRIARVRDNVALMADSMAARMHALDVDLEKSSFAQAHKTVAATRAALAEIVAQEHDSHERMNQVFARMGQDIEASFIHLGLSEVQEEHLSIVLRRHFSEAMETLEQSNQIEARLQQLISKLNA